MVIAIRNATGIDLHLAISVSDGEIRFRITSVPPVLEDGEHAERLRAGASHGIVNCPEGIAATIDASGAGLAIRAAARRSVLDRIDDDGQLDGEEIYLEITLLLMN